MRLYHGGYRDVGVGPRGAGDGALDRAGLVSGAGSLGALLSAPIGQILNEGYGWRIGSPALWCCRSLMIPAAWYAGRVDKIPLPQGRA